MLALPLGHYVLGLELGLLVLEHHVQCVNKIRLHDLSVNTRVGMLRRYTSTKVA
jgi:hypothetical protein